MRFEYDESTNTVFLYLVDEIANGAVVRSGLLGVELKESAVIASFDRSGDVLKVEFMGANKVFSEGMLTAIGEFSSADRDKRSDH